jgi:hypothetical protein
MAAKPDVKHHPNQERKSGGASYASPVKKNASTNDPRNDSVVGGVEEKMKKEITKSRNERKNGKGNVPGKRRANSDR